MKDGKKFNLEELMVRELGLRRQLDQAWDLLIRRGWWSYLTDFPIIDHEVIMTWVLGKEHQENISIHYLFNEPENMWEIVLAMVDEVELSFPYPPGKIQPDKLMVNGEPDA